MTVSQTAERFGTNKPRMSYPSFQPHSCIKPMLSHDRTSKSDAALHDDSCLLGVNGNRSVSSGSCDVAIKRFAQHRRFATEMVGQPIAATRMPDVRRDKAVAAFWTSPQRFASSAIPHIQQVPKRLS